VVSLSFFFFGVGHRLEADFMIDVWVVFREIGFDHKLLFRSLGHLCSDTRFGRQLVILLSSQFLVQ
jgi:hypothetical protein